MKVVIDEGVPRQVVTALLAQRVDASRFPLQWVGARNGNLIKALDRLGFDVLLTNDKNIASQQSLIGRRIAVVALPHNKRRAILDRIVDVADTIRLARPGQHVVMEWDGSRSATQVVDGVTSRHDLPPVPCFRT